MGVLVTVVLVTVVLVTFVLETVNFVERVRLDRRFYRYTYNRYVI